jgi:fused signal recognition particle receptor
VAGFFSRLKGGLSKTRDNMVKGLDNVFSGYSEIDGDFYDDLEETLIMGDIGVNATSRILDRLRSQVEEKKIRSTVECRDLLIQDIREQMHTDEHAYDFENQKSVLFIIGVNGVGKTTSVGKLASIYKNKGKKVLVAAADTYRAAATEQLEEWTNRAGVPLVKGAEGADPASVIFDAVNSAKAKNIDILIVDTAGRLHNKKNLMEELRKMNRILDNHLPDYKRENLIVLDGTTGQNAMSQAREFGEVTDLTGIILTKMDGTSKGGIAVAIVSELNIPVKYIGVGESLDDLERFEPQEFVDALFDIDHEERVRLDQDIVARKLSSGEMDSSQLTEEEAIDILTRH